MTEFCYLSGLIPLDNATCWDSFLQPPRLWKWDSGGGAVNGMRICPTYNFLVLSLLAVAVTAGCSPLSKAQIEAVGELTFRSDTVSRSPAILFEEMSELRLERGLYYAASLSSGTARYEEVTALAEASMDDEALVRKAAGYVDVFNSYVRALHSVSSEARWTGIGTEIRGIGSRVDSVLYRYNRLDTGYEDIPVGYARMAGRPWWLPAVTP